MTAGSRHWAAQSKAIARIGAVVRFIGIRGIERGVGMEIGRITKKMETMKTTKVATAYPVAMRGYLSSETGKNRACEKNEGVNISAPVGPQGGTNLEDQRIAKALPAGQLWNTMWGSV